MANSPPEEPFSQQLSWEDVSLTSPLLFSSFYIYIQHEEIFFLVIYLLSCVWQLRVVAAKTSKSDPMDCSPPGSSVHGISQAKILEWVAISFSRRWSLSRDWTLDFCIGRQVLYRWATREAEAILDFFLI